VREDKISKTPQLPEILRFVGKTQAGKRTLGFLLGELTMQKWLLLLLLGAAAPAANLWAEDKAKESDGWIQMWDGQTMKGWKASENSDSWKIEDGALVCHGPRSHLFYMAEEPFKNFEFECEVKTTPHSNAGIYFHGKYQETGWPKYGYEVQVNVTHSDPKKSGGLYATADVSDPPCKDNEWYTQTIIVNGRHVISKINGKTVVDYTEPENKPAFSKEFERRLGEGTFALQAHDPESKVYFRNLKVKRLP
jgi:hypothetical protein